LIFVAAEKKEFDNNNQAWMIVTILMLNAW